MFSKEISGNHLKDSPRVPTLEEGEQRGETECTLHPSRTSGEGAVPSPLHRLLSPSVSFHFVLESPIHQSLGQVARPNGSSGS